VKGNQTGRTCSKKGEERNAYIILMGKIEGKRPLGRPRHRWVDNIKMGLTVIGIGGANWIYLDGMGFFKI
jgi:hypothetical protein